MATMPTYELHDHAGLRWLLPFAIVLALVCAGALLMAIYPWHKLLS